MKKNLLAIVCVLVAGCSTRGQVNPDVMQIATAPLTCTTKAECDAWWQRARTWVTTHAHYDVTAATDTLIQTAGPDGGKRLRPRGLRGHVQQVHPAERVARDRLFGCSRQAFDRSARAA